MSEETCPDCGLPTWHSRMACLEARLSAATARASELEKTPRATKDGFYRWWSGLTNEERVSCWYDLDAMAHGEVLVALRDKLAKRDADLAAMGERVARAERENEAWLALNGFASCDYNNLTRSQLLSCEEEPDRYGMRAAEYEAGNNEPKYSYGEGPTPQAAAIDLATKLGLIAKQEAVEA